LSIQEYLQERLKDLIPKGNTDSPKPNGRIKLDKSLVPEYEKAVRDCKEHKTIDSAIDSVYRGLRTLDLMPYTPYGEEWLGSFKNDVTVGNGGVAKIYLRKDNKKVSNGYVMINLSKNSFDEYEVSSKLIVK
jgi:hypothetical protein